MLGWHAQISEAYRAQVGELVKPDTEFIHLELGSYSLAHIEATIS